MGLRDGGLWDGGFPCRLPMIPSEPSVRYLYKQHHRVKATHCSTVWIKESKTTRFGPRDADDSLEMLLLERRGSLSERCDPSGLLQIIAAK